MNYVNVAMKYAQKSMSRDHKHGAVCVVGGKVVSAGYNFPNDPHIIKVCQGKQVQV